MVETNNNNGWLNSMGIKLEVQDGVWPPYKTGQLIATEIMPRYADVIRGGIVVDVGTGSGLFAVRAGNLGAAGIYALDLNEKAIETTRRNWEINGYTHGLHAIVSDGLAGLPNETEGQVDLIIANPPVQPMVMSNMDGGYTKRANAYAWNEAANHGRSVLDDILLNGPHFLRVGGKIVTSTSTRHGWNKTTRMLNALTESGEISDWKEIHRETHPLAPFYDQYVPTWLDLQKSDGDTRILQDENGVWHHDFIVIEATK